jgi:hypothetical protein
LRQVRFQAFGGSEDRGGFSGQYVVWGGHFGLL